MVTSFRYLYPCSDGLTTPLGIQPSTTSLCPPYWFHMDRSHSWGLPLRLLHCALLFRLQISLSSHTGDTVCPFQIPCSQCIQVSCQTGLNGYEASWAVSSYTPQLLSWYLVFVMGTYCVSLLGMHTHALFTPVGLVKHLNIKNQT